MDKPDWPAPAKINLFLHVTGRRRDGYHLLQTVFQFLDCCDTLSFDIRQDGVVRRISDIPGVPADDDLSVRAARLLQQATGTRLGVDIFIHKRLPLGGGLGGGSSDAATTLCALNHLWGLGFTQDQLAGYGLQLGADVPVFIHGQAAWAEGIGEQLTPLLLDEPWYAVIVPPCHVSTAAIFNDPELTRDSHPIRIEGFISGQGVNVCEPVVIKHYPLVGEALDWLSRYAPSRMSGARMSGARMSGTGASVFASFDSRELAERVVAEVPDQWYGFICKGLNRSPLLDALSHG